MDNKIWEENIGVALKFIVDNFGKHALLNSSEVYVMLNELVPKLSRESKWIKEAIDLGIVEIFLEEKNIDENNRNIAINKVRDVLKEDYIAEDRISFIVDSLVYGLGWSDIKEDSDMKNEEVIENHSSPEDNIAEDDIENEENNFNENVYKQYINNVNNNDSTNNDNSDDNDNSTNNDNPIETINPNNNQSDINNQNQDNTNLKDVKEVDFTDNTMLEDSEDLNSTNDENCKQESSTNDIDSKSNKEINLKNRKYKFIIPIIILVILGSMGVGIYNNIKSNKAYVNEFTFDIKHKKEDSKYIFKKGDFIVMNVSLKGENPNKIDESNLSYKVDDTSICKVSNEFNKCRITGIGVGETKIHIYYKKDKIKSIDLKFR